MTFIAESLGIPIYGVAYDADSKLIVAVGGGGSSKSGVKNKIIAYRMDHELLKIKQLATLDTGSEAPMNVSIHQKTILVGVNDRCWKVELDEEDITNISLDLTKTLQTDFSTDDSYQKIVKYSFYGKCYATAGMDGFIRVWNGNGKVGEIESGEASDLSFNRDGSCLAYTSTKSLNLYDISNSAEIRKLSASKDCQFRCIHWLSDDRILVIENSVDRKQSKLVIFSDSQLKVSKVRTIPVKKSVTATAIDFSESFLSFGCADGTVGVFSLLSMKVIVLIPNYHSFAVTSVQLATTETHILLISGSPDGFLKIVKRLKSSSPTRSIVLVVMVILVAIVAFLVQNETAIKSLIADL